MKCSISITGQISGNFTLANTLQGSISHKRGMFNSFELEYRTRAEAKKAIAKAFTSLNSDREDARNSMLRKSKDNTVLRYDASVAKLSDKY